MNGNVSTLAETLHEKSGSAALLLDKSISVSSCSAINIILTMVLPSAIKRTSFDATKTIRRARLLRRAVETCAIIAVLSASFEALLSSKSMPQRNAMATDRAHSWALCSEDRDHCKYTNSKDGALYNTTPSGWWPTDQWLEQCAEEEMAKEHETDNNEFEIPSEWHKYRLGDCIKMCCACGNFPDSLASLYNERACQEHNLHNKTGGNEAIIDEILQMRDGVKGFVKPADDEMLIHVRLGDVVEESRDDVATMLVHGGIPKQSNFRNVRGIKSAFELLSNAHESGAHKVKMIGGSHKRVNATKSRPYAECLRKTFETAGYEVSLEVGTANPDQDFYRLSHAKHIVVGSGGYSRLVGRNAERHGGKIYGRFF